ncbi:endonuclease/exonuclease/phosphatase family protein [Anaerophaga thermohalophila]|jgi:endonuclease/exonuclease/phosphatase family metal-dependent hydrolase|uniref:endonuclease/exonuclease/phosphatase family protein n=1 Tax=Anaerophaga thermohalophila TaxID=177400 RepID=UPI0002F41CB2|nr:endonuclease [Anaerophaga thermohalophila]
MTRFLLLFFLYFCLACGTIFSQTPETANILFYNVENLFNPAKNEGKLDDEFLPDGPRHWTHSRKSEKQVNISRVILFSGKWNPPVLVGLCEVEDRKVLDGLIWDTGLDRFKYSVIHFESPDRRGIDVALLYRQDRFSVLDAFPLAVEMPENSRPTRDILYVSGVLDNNDTLHIMVNHWPSRWGGEGTTRSKRLIAAKTLKNICDSILSDAAGSKIIVMGDFNDNPWNESMRLISRKPSENREGLVNLAYNIDGDVPGTIKHRHEWSCFDQVLVSESLLKPLNNSYAVTDSVMHIVTAPFLLEDDPDFPGSRPFRTYAGYNYLGGFSDHLPVMVELKKRAIE